MQSETAISELQLHFIKPHLDKFRAFWGTVLETPEDVSPISIVQIHALMLFSFLQG